MGFTMEGHIIPYAKKHKEAKDSKQILSTKSEILNKFKVSKS